jgi:ribonuclease Z
MDHFYGFDRVLRCCHATKTAVNVYGPPGIICNVQGKLNGYTWNLVNDYNFSLTVYELNKGNTANKTIFSAKNSFAAENSGVVKIDIGESFSLDYTTFDHGTASIGYRITEPTRYRVDGTLFPEYGYVAGPWVGLLKKLVDAEIYDAILDVQTTAGTIKRSVSELKSELLTKIVPQVLTYITDISPSEENAVMAAELAKNSTLLIIEATFSSKDADHASKKNHLTTAMAKNIFLQSDSKYVHFTHFSSRYEQMKGEFWAEITENMRDRIFYTEE